MSRDTATLLGAFVLGALLVASVVVAGLPANALSDDPASVDKSTPGESITVSASGQAGAQPDTAVLRLAVTATADDATTARRQVAENVSSMRAALAEAGVESSQIRTLDYDLRQRRPRDERTGDAEVEYYASHAFEVRVTDLETAGTVIDAAVDGGATNVHDVSFTLSEDRRRSLRQQALEDAMDNARGQADVLADRSSLTITGVHTVTTSEVRYPGPVLETAASAGDAATDLAAGPVTVTATVQVTYDASA
ncbi:SIMPL domain-containing protein [Halobacteriaceae archaeon GCM10025711]